MNILDYIGFGKGNAVTRDQLCAYTGLSDRAVRKLIEVERNNGAIIINDGDGDGYYQSEKLEDMLSQYRMNNRRAKSILRQQKHLRSRIMDKFAVTRGQMTIDEVEANEYK